MPLDRPRSQSTWRRLLDEPPVRPFVAVASILALLLVVPRAVADALARLEPAVLLALSVLVLIGVVGARAGGRLGRGLAVTSTVLVVMAAVGLVTARPAGQFVDGICAAGCVVQPVPNSDAIGPVLEAWFITGLANLVPIVVGLWAGGRVAGLLLGEDAPIGHPVESMATIEHRVETGPLRLQRHSARIITGMRLPIWPWRH